MKKTFWIFGLLVALGFALGDILMKRPVGLELHVLDIGQGDALLLQTPEGQNVLVDGGPGQSVLEELGEVLSPLDRKLDMVILTHPHEDHVAGLVSVVERFEVGRVVLSAPEYPNLAYEALLEELTSQGITYSFADDDQDFDIGSARLDFLYPFEPFTGDSMENVNNASPVVKVIWEDVEILLTGDAEQEVEAELLAAGVDVSADFLKAGHHGSRTSSTWDFLLAVGAETMLISCGEGNDYGHPHPETLEKAEDLDMAVWRTDLHGRITLTCTVKKACIIHSRE